MKLIPLIAALAIAACSHEEQAQPPTPAESDQLNEAEDMLDGLEKEEGAVPESTAPPENLN